MATALENLKVLKSHGAYYDKHQKLWHVPLFSANSNQKEFFGEGEYVFNEAYETATDKINELTSSLELKNNDTLELMMWDVDKWLVYNKRNNSKTLVQVTTNIGADDGHNDFVSGWAKALASVGDITVTIPDLFDNKEEMLEQLAWMYDNEWL